MYSTLNKTSLNDVNQNRVYLEVGGVRYEGWMGISIKHSIETLCGAFDLTVFDKWNGQTSGWDISAGNSCVVKIGSDVMITGYVDANSVSMDASSHTITIQGRDKAGDLVDCSAVAKEWTGQKFEFIANELTRPFGVTVTTQLASDESGYTTKQSVAPAKNGGKKLARQSVKGDQTVQDALKKMAEVQGVLIISDRKGGLLITRAGLGGRCADALVLGENLKQIEYNNDFTEVFSKITVKGQAHGAKTAAGQPLDRKQGALAKGEIERELDQTIVGRYRPLIITAGEQTDSTKAKLQAEWEASTREAKAKKLSVTVQGWRQSNGEIWSINTLVRIKCPWVREDDDFVISSAEYSIGESGTETKMELVSPKSYTPNPTIAKKEAAKKSTRGVNSKKQVKR